MDEDTIQHATHGTIKPHGQNAPSCTSTCLVHDFEHLIRLNQLNNQAFFLRGVGHMLNNPINSIQLANKLFGVYTQDIADLFDSLDDEPDRVPAHFRKAGLDALSGMHQVIQGINDSTGKLNQLVNCLSQCTGKGPFSGNNTIDINEVILQCVSMAHHQICLHTNSLKTDLQSSLPVVYGNAQHMTQVVLNLLMNALLSLHDRSCPVEVSTSCDHTGRIRMCIRDSGSGILPEIFPLIFEPFFTTWGNMGCIGTGLTVARGIIRNHGGELSIDSEPGEGTTVMVSLPLHKPLRESDNA